MKYKAITLSHSINGKNGSHYKQHKYPLRVSRVSYIGIDPLPTAFLITPMTIYEM